MKQSKTYRLHEVTILKLNRLAKAKNTAATVVIESLILSATPHSFEIYTLEPKTPKTAPKAQSKGA